MTYISDVLYSYSADRFYYGYTTNLMTRYFDHNNSNKGFTTRFRPWTVVFVEHFSTENAARAREKYYKSGIGKEKIKENFSREKGFALFIFSPHFSRILLKTANDRNHQFYCS